MASSKKISKRKSASSDFERVNLKLSSSTLKALEQKAKRYAKGNLSAWIRFAAVKYSPRPSDIKALAGRQIR